MLSTELALAIVIGVILFVGWLVHNSYRNDIIEIKRLLNEVPGDIKSFNNGLKDSVSSKLRNAKPRLPEDLDEFSDILIKMLKKDWVLSYDWNTAVHYYQIAQLAAVKGWQAEWYQDPNTQVCYVRMTKGR